ncbi:MAG: T9SS type A sorting domain-containing protein [Ignavibacteria bacterium]|jgi:hypothetical protein|nr:T9SS type A sorting domain-containing protein [Ignavibacteria bacterium]MDH7526588.1 T9SS type A sorting domain-containing protein [Ignavibacteria bacterium]
MKKFFTLLLLFISYFNLLSQEKITEGVLFVGTFGVDENEKVKYFLESERITWINPSDTIFSITNDSSLINSELETTGISNNDPSKWNCWFSYRSGYSPVITYGFYKIINSKNNNLYFYLDTRDCRWSGSVSNSYNPDIFIKFDFGTNTLNYSVDKTNWYTFKAGSLLKVWEIKNQGLPVTKYFEPPQIIELNINNYDNHPFLFWECKEFYTGFLIERRKNNSNWFKLNQTNENHFIDYDITWNGGNNSITVEYRVWTINTNLMSSNPSPIKSITINPEIQKQSINLTGDNNFKPFQIPLFISRNLSKDSDQWLFIRFDTSQYLRQDVYNIIIDKNENVWLSFSLYNTYNALIKYDGFNWYYWKISDTFNVNPNHFISAIDSNNIIWLYMVGKGLISFDGYSFSSYSTPLIAVKYPRMNIDKSRNKWIIAPVGSGVLKVDSLNNYYFFNTSNSPLPSNNGMLVIPYGDSIWICTFKGLVLLYNNEWKIYDTTNTKMPSQEITYFVKDLYGTRWLGTRRMGLLKWINDSTFIVFNSNNAPFTNNYINVITVDKFNNLWIGTDDGLLKYDGTNFTLFDQTTNRSIVDIKIDKFNNKWIASDYGQDWGLAIFNENGISGVNLPTNVYDNNYIEKKFILFQNYPNPFNSKTKIKFSIPISGFTSLRIYNLLGQEIVTLVNEHKQIGEYEIEFNADQYNLSTGVYIYQLKNNSLVQTKKFILMK